MVMGITAPLTKKKRIWSKNRKSTLRGSQLNYNASQQMRYKQALEKLVDTMTDEVVRKVKRLFDSQTGESFFDQQKLVAAMDDSIASQARILMNILMRKFTRLFGERAKTLAEQMVSGSARVSKSALHTSLKQLSGGLSLKTGVVPKGMNDVATAIVAENVSLIKSIPTQYFTNITGAVMRSITTGAGLKDLVPYFSKYRGQTVRRAKNLALDQTRKAYNSINKQRMQAIGVKQFEWVHSGGGQHPRRSHQAMSGNIYGFDDLPVINKEQVDRGYEGPVKGIPGQAINCFTGSTEVSLANGCINLWRYFHDGDIVTLSVQGDCVIKCTPNHPILTLRGWLAANEIQEGDYLVSSQRDDGGVGNNKNTDVKTAFDKLFSSLSVTECVGFSLGSKFNFHGDIPKNNVDTISPQNILPSRIELPTSEQIEQFVFTLSDIIRNTYIPSFNAQVIQFGSACGFTQLFSLVDGQFRHTDFSSVTTVTQDYAVIQKDSHDNLSTDFVLQSERKYTFLISIGCDNLGTITINPGFVCHDRQRVVKTVFESAGKMTGTDFANFTKVSQGHSCIKTLYRVSKKSIGKFTGHVYTMESNNGWYTVAGAEIISKNCKCTMVPVIKFED